MTIILLLFALGTTPPCLAQICDAPDIKQPALQDNGQHNGQKVPVDTSARQMGNIAPYRRDLLERLSKNWHPRETGMPTVLLTLEHSGKLLSSEILRSSGNSQVDAEALAAVNATSFAPLPDWYKGATLRFKVNLERKGYKPGP